MTRPYLALVALAVGAVDVDMAGVCNGSMDQCERNSRAMNASNRYDDKRA